MDSTLQVNGTVNKIKVLIATIRLLLFIQAPSNNRYI